MIDISGTSMELLEKLAGIETRYEELNQLMSDPAVLGDYNRLREVGQERTTLQPIVEAYREYREALRKLAEARHMATHEADAELAALANEEIASLDGQIAAMEANLKLLLVPKDPRDDKNVIVEIRAGTGGDEAGIFAADLYRMYQKFCAERGWKASPIDASGSERGGFKEVVFRIEGNGVYGILRYESGVHRVQRVPVTEASGRIHTSTATVVVLPEAEIEDDIEIKPDEIRVDIFCSSGPGGQGVNTTYSAVRITHLPTGIVAQSQDERSQHRNKEIAMSVLKARLLDIKRREEEMKMGNMRRSQIGSGDRSEKIRTYNFPQNRLTDHRINFTVYNLDQVMEGRIGELLSSLRQHDVEMKLKKLTASDQPEK